MWQVRLSGSIKVFKEDVELPPAPNATVEVLFVGLLAQRGEWVYRSQLSELLYPRQSSASAANALRQSLYRLRRWLGEDCIEISSSRLRLFQSEFTVDLFSADVNVPAAMIAAGLDHPWLDQIRISIAIQSPKKDKPLEFLAKDYFYQAVVDASQWDRDLARELMVGGKSFASLLSSNEMTILLSSTEPRDRRDPLVVEHRELKAILLCRHGEIPRASAVYSQALKLSRHQQDWSACYRLGAMKLLAEVESGNFLDASETYREMEFVPGAKTNSLIMTNARACYLWNQNHFDKATETMRTGLGKIESAGRAEQLHYFTNYAHLCAEAGDIAEATSAMTEAAVRRIPLVDTGPAIIGMLTDATIQLRNKDTDAAIGLLQRTVEEAKIHESRLVEWYACESLAECFARKGDISNAWAHWTKSEHSRLKAGMKLTPRLRVRKDRIQQSLSH